MIKTAKYIFTLIIIFITMAPVLSIESSDSDEHSAAIIKGTFLKVINLDEISTLTLDIEDEVMFMNSQDMYVYETNIFPENSKIIGEVEDVLEPVEGRDGAIKINIKKIITPDKKVYKVKGHIYSENDNYLGGGETQPVYYRKVPVYNQRIRPVLKVAPLNVYEKGKHTIIKPGSELFLILEEDVSAK